MAYKDTEAFLRERGVLFDPSLDINPGSPFDNKVVQPMLRRLGTDPFTTDITTFINDRMVQAYPDLATKEGDTLTDLLNKPVTLLFDPLVRENTRVVRNLSFRDPPSLTLDEADALGANYYSNRRTGEYSRGVSRIYFNSPQDITVSPVNFLTTRGGLHFWPRSIQSIRSEEMILNYDQDVSLYFFDINCISEKPGTEYNIEPGEMFSISNVAAAVRVDNIRRYQFGETEETAEEFIDRIQQELSERSMVTLRGIASKLLENFPEVTRLNVVGMNDPEMQRDVIQGGGLGEIIAHGVAGSVIADSEGAAFSRRFYTAEEDFTALSGGAATSWVLTVFEAFGASVIKARDINVSGIYGANELDLEDQVMVIGSSSCRWTLRRRELTISSLPGGIVFPDTANGTVAIPDGEVHVGGAYDVHVRGSSFDEATLVISNVTDDEPLLAGEELTVESGTPNTVKLNGLVMGLDYDEFDDTYDLLESAELLGYSLQILDGGPGVAGNYRILRSTQVAATAVELELTPAPSNPGVTQYRWRLFDEINIDLVEPKESRISGSDLRTLQGSDVVDTSGGINFSDYGVAEGDTIRILTGEDADDYSLVADPIAPSFDSLQIDTELSRSASNLQFIIFRPNDAGGLLRPLIRVSSMELLDSSSQPLGSVVPYAKPIDIQSRAFQNPTRGVKHDFREARVGLLTDNAPWTGSAYEFTGVTIGQDLIFWMKDVGVVTVTMTNNNPTPAEVAFDIVSDFGGDHPQGAVVVGVDRVGVRPRKGGVFCIGGSAMAVIYGGTDLQSTFDVRDDDVSDWTVVDPEIDLDSGLDVVQVLDGVSVGFYEFPFLVEQAPEPAWTGVTDSLALMVGAEYDAASGTYGGSGFAPEVDRRVQIGARSLGSVRVFFLEPTSFEVDADTRFKLETDTGDLFFLPDPTLTYQRIPSLPSGVQPVDGSAAPGGDLFSSASQDFVLSAIRPGDVLQVRTRPIAGTIPLPNPVPELVYRTLVFSLDAGPNRTVTFIRDDASLDPDEVSRNGVLDQINSVAGEEICQLTGSNTLEFHTTRDLVIRATGTANMPDAGPPAFAGILGDLADTGGATDFTIDQNNESPMAGDYDIISVSQTQLQASSNFPSPASPFTLNPLTRQSYRVLRQGVQRIVATAMADNEAEAGLYYFDVELLSEGSGDTWNIDADQQLTVEGYRSDGYYLTTDDENLTFSDAEPVKLVLSRTILEAGVNDDPANATQLSSQNIQLTYQRSGIVGDVQNFALSETERVVCSSPLSRHLIPHFVRFDMTYVGGADESVVVPETETYIRKIYPQDALESSDIQKIALDRGAVSITNPIDLVAIVHYTDRTVYATRSQDALTTGRLAAFIPDVLNITKRVS